MKSHFLGSRRFKACALTLAAAAWLAVGCGNNGGAGDGVYDDSIPPGGASGAGRSGSSAGAPSAGAGNRGGAAGASQGGAAGSGGNAGKGGSGGAAEMGGGAGNVSGMSGGAGMSASGSTAGGGSAVCGNGKIEAGEACDSGMPPGMGGAGGADGARAGSGTAGGGGDDQSRAGAPSVVPKYGQICSNTCYNVGTQACLDCEFAGDCVEFVDACLGPSDAPFTAAQQTACYAVMHCIQASNCFDGTGTVGKCYCGSLSTMACGAAPFIGAGSPDGACTKELQAGFPSLKSNSAVIANFAATQFPSGAATNHLSCQKGASSGACAGVCGFTAGGPAFP